VKLALFYEIPHPKVLQTIDLLGKHVIPELERSS